MSDSDTFPMSHAEAVAEQSELRTVGPYRLLSLIGHGGMGTVYLAEQTAPVRRTVALKIIRAGYNSPEMMARFDSERQSLAIMEHANIAQVFDTGTTPDGQPYFAMEYVQGLPVTRYCDQNRLDVSARLKVFLQICSAIQHAHQKGIMHRDLKPNNILVTTDSDGQHIVKVIDFGLAKALSGAWLQNLQQGLTSVGQIVGTPQYMSPEQAGPNCGDIDTRADVFSLGIILFELLTGATPLDPDRLKSDAIDQILRSIREDDTPLPSSRLSGTLEAVKAVSDNRRITPTRLRAILRGELDWVVARSLEKDRSRRYQSVAELSEDVKRYLNSEPVLARPRSLSYGLRKLTARHRSLVITASLLVLTILSGTIGVTWALVKSTRAEMQLANSNEILATIFDDIDINQIRQTNQPLENVFAKRLITAADALTENEIGDPQVVARLQLRLARSLIGLGFANDAGRLLHKSAETFPENSRDSLLAKTALATAYHQAGHVERALALAESTTGTLEKVFGQNEPDLHDAYNNLGAINQSLKRFDAAIALFEKAYSLSSGLTGDANKQRALQCLNNLASTHYLNGNDDAAIPLFQKVLEGREQLLPSNHPDVIESMTNLAHVFQDSGRMTEAAQLNEDALRRAREVAGDDHPLTLTIMGDLGRQKSLLGDLEDATRLLRQVVAVSEKRFGRDQFQTQLAVANLATNLRDAKHFEEAIELFAEAATFSFQDPRLSKVRESFRKTCIDGKRIDLFLETAESHMHHARQTLNSDSIELSDILCQIGREFHDTRNFDKAEELLQECLKIRRAVDLTHWKTFNAMSLLGETMAKAQHFDRAERLLVDGYEGLKTSDNVPVPTFLSDAETRLAEFRRSQGASDAAGDLDTKETDNRTKP